MNSPVRVLHPITRLIVGGAQENTLYTAAMLDPTRFQAEVISGPQTGSEGSLIEEAHQRGIHLTILPDLLRQVNPWHDSRALAALVRRMRSGRYTIVHTHSSKAGILGRLAARLAGVPIIVHTVHGWSFHDYLTPRARRMYILLERWTARFTDALVVVTQRDIHKGLQAGIGQLEQYHLIRSAIPLEEFDPARYNREQVRQELGIPAQAVVLGNVGRFSAQKNPLDWVRVASQVESLFPRQNPCGLHFLLVGDGPLRPAVEAALQQAGIAQRTTLTGLRRDVPRLMDAMDIFLLTSLWEGLPRVLPQAMAMGLPVVANHADGVAEAIQDGHSGYLVSPGDLTAAAKACARLALDPAMCRRLGKVGQAYARQEFSLERMIAQLDSLYTSLLKDVR